MIIYLIGLPGVGKTTLGRKVATELNYQFLDLDNQIEKKYGNSISKIFEIEGEDYFRKLEKRELEKTFKLDKFVIATGGGTPCFFDNITLMNKHGRTVYLFTTPKKILQYLSKAEIKKRPIFKGGEKKLEELYEIRTVYYEKATYKLDLEKRDYFNQLIQIIGKNGNTMLNDLNY